MSTLTPNVIASVISNPKQPATTIASSVGSILLVVGTSALAYTATKGWITPAESAMLSPTIAVFVNDLVDHLQQKLSGIKIITTASVLLLAGLMYMPSGCANLSTPSTQPTSVGVLSATGVAQAYDSSVSAEVTAINAGLLTKAQAEKLEPGREAAWAAVLAADAAATQGAGAEQGAAQTALAVIASFNSNIPAVPATTQP